MTRLVESDSSKPPVEIVLAVCRWVESIAFGYNSCFYVSFSSATLSVSGLLCWYVTHIFFLFSGVRVRRPFSVPPPRSPGIYIYFFCEETED